MNEQARLETTKFIWRILGAVLIALFISAGIGNGLEAEHAVLGVVAFIAGAISTGVIWTSEQSQNETMEAQEKVKRERLDAVLRDLSDEDLLALKNRLSDGSVDDEVLYERMTLSDDGELVGMGRKR